MPIATATSLDRDLTPAARAARDTLTEVLRPCRPVLDDPTTEELMINTADDIWAVRSGRTEQLEFKLDPLRLSAALRAIATLNDRDLVETSGRAILDTVLDGNRIAACLATVAERGDMMCIRRPRERQITVDEYLRTGFFEPRGVQMYESRASDMERAAARGGAALLDYLAFCIEKKDTVLVSGGTATGKTSFLNMLLDFVPKHERLVVCEDTKEVRSPNPNYVRLIEDKANAVRMQQLVELSLRLRPDRLIVGEVRGAAAVDLITAFNTDQPGFGTLHANSAREVLIRLETMLRREAGDSASSDSLRGEIATAVQLIVQLDAPYHPQTKQRQRFLREVLRVKGYSSGEYQLQTVYSAYRAAD